MMKILKLDLLRAVKFCEYIKINEFKTLNKEIRSLSQ